MKKLSSKVKFIVLSSLIAPVALAANEGVSVSGYAEPIYLSICGVILLAFGMLKDKKSEA